MRKIIQLDSVTPNNEATLQLIRFDKPEGFQKIASERAVDFIQGIGPKPGKTYVLVLAMSAHEFYGPNSNKDSFPENPIPGIVEPGETLKDCYKSFETSAKVFKHHKNTDPARSIGDIVRSFYNDKMHRVELLLELDNQKAADIISKIERGEYPPVSMGCRVKYDVCSKCLHRAKNLGEYCEHAQLQMGEIDPKTGEQIFVYNPAPTLFDISFVLRPADKIAYMMKKVAKEPIVSSAELGEVVKLNQLKSSAIKKLSDIDKTITGQTLAMSPDPALLSFSENILPTLMTNGAQPFSSPLCDCLSKLPLAKLFSTLHQANVVPTGKEICHIIIRKSFPETQIDPRIYDLTSALQGPIRSLLSEFPEIINAIQSLGLVEAIRSNGDQKIIENFGDELTKRSFLLENIYSLATSLPLKKESSLIFDPIEFELNNRKYIASSQILEASRKDNKARQILGTIGAAALGLGTFGALMALRQGRSFAPIALGGGLLGTKATHALLDVPTFPGTDIPVNVPKRPAPLPLIPEEGAKQASETSSDLSLAFISAQEYFPAASKKTASFEESKAYHLFLLKNATKKSTLLEELINLHCDGKTKIAEVFDHYFENPGDPVHRGPVKIENLITDLGREIFKSTT